MMLKINNRRIEGYKICYVCLLLHYFSIFYIYKWVIIYLIQRAVVRGSIKPCDGERFPSIFVRLDNYEVLKWIMETVFPDEPPIEDPSKIIIQGISWQNVFFQATTRIRYETILSYFDFLKCSSGSTIQYIYLYINLWEDLILNH